MDNLIEFFPQQLALWSGLKASQTRATNHSYARYMIKERCPMTRWRGHRSSIVQSLAASLRFLVIVEAMLMSLTFSGLAGLDAAWNA